MKAILHTPDLAVEPAYFDDAGDGVRAITMLSSLPEPPVSATEHSGRKTSQ